MWFRGGEKAAHFWKGDALFLAFIQTLEVCLEVKLVSSVGTQSVSAQV